jgi:hypothetical protein
MGKKSTTKLSGVKSAKKTNQSFNKKTSKFTTKTRRKMKPYRGQGR